MEPRSSTTTVTPLMPLAPTVARALPLMPWALKEAQRAALRLPSML
jgi:hypothetical protein